ncbi:DUF1775 domain-containing protein [Jannaschia sp. R86511]|uniref:DUF1775 domain-containing protein n=1 Tax=Jannaschia sp. R86511 TaxID=3093853 RepID=UPI0036D2234A
MSPTDPPAPWPRRTRRRRAAVAATSALLGALAWFGAVPPASAHVSLVQAVPLGDGSTGLTFELDHGCEQGEGTTGLDLTAAAGVTYLSADGPDGWAAVVSPTSVRWDGPAVPDGERVRFDLRAEVVGVPGDTVHLPVVQRCEQDAAYAWVDTDPASSTPAPSLVLTGAVISGATQPEPTGAGPLGVALTVAVAGLGLGAVGAVAASGRRSG